MSRYDLWKETAAWWHLEGEAFWWFGPDYSAGIPQAIYVLDPRRMRNEEPLLRGVGGFVTRKNRRWFYQTDTETIPILRDELIHFKDWNPWNPARGVNPLAALALELEQDYYANKANSQLLKNNAIPQGILKTDQSIRPEEADALERRWESKYGMVRANRKIAVLGKGTEFKPLSFTPEVVKLFELKRWNLYTILAKYGIPPRVANISDKSTALSGKDTGEQHAAFWKYTLIPLLKNFEQILETQFFSRLGLPEEGVFDVRDIPELQESEDAQSNRDITEINAGLKTINDVLKERGKEPSGTKFPHPGATGGIGPKTFFRFINLTKPRRSEDMRYNNAIIATNADFLADILRDTLRDFNAGPVLTVRNENELMSGIKNGCPRFVFLENCFRDGVTEEYVRRLTRRYRDIRVVVWSASEVKPPRAARYILAGAESYFSLRDTDKNIADIVRLIAGGRRYCPPDVKAIIESDTYFPDVRGKLTLREIEIIKLSITRKNNREIAGTLGISVATVKFHKASIYRKCGGNTPVDILRYGLAQGIILPEDIGGTER